MLKIKDRLFKEELIKIIKPDYYANSTEPYVIYVEFIDGLYEIVEFDEEEERNKELNSVLKKAI